MLPESTFQENSRRLLLPQPNSYMPKMTPIFTIREATLADSDPISKLVYRLAEKFIAQEFTREGAETLLSSMGLTAIKKFIGSGFGYHIAKIDDRLVGVIGIRDNSQIYHLFVDEKYQNLGIARELWRVARESCLSKGNPGIFTVNSSRYALPVYVKFGFITQSSPQEKNGVIYIPMKLSING
jgi:GNAT superfamily N-acetyltransferase